MRVGGSTNTPTDETGAACFCCLARQRQAIETERGFLLQSVGIFLQSVGFPFDVQGPDSSRNVLLHFLYDKAIEDGNRTCSPPFLLGLVGRMTYLDLTLNISGRIMLNVKHFWTDNAKTRNFVLGPTKYESLKSTIARKCS